MIVTKPKCVIFDWDNTLISTWPKIAMALNSALEFFDKPRWSIAEVKANSHKSLKDGFPIIFGHNWEEARDIFYKVYEETSDIEALEGGERILKLLQKNNIKAGIVSNKRGDILRKEVQDIGWDDYFFGAVGSLDAHCDKPHPDPVYHLLEGIHMESSNKVWFIGDTTVDIECAVNSGCIPILFGDKTSSPDLDEKHFKYLQVKNHNEFYDLITKYLE